MNIEDVDALEAWIVKTLEPICDIDPTTLAKYLIALAKKGKPQPELKALCEDHLHIFLGDETKGFVGNLFDALTTKSYMPPLLIEDFDALEAWIVETLKPICDIDPATLAKYLIALAKKGKAPLELKTLCEDHLHVFLGDETEGFVGSLFDALTTKSYMQQPALSKKIKLPYTNVVPSKKIKLQVSDDISPQKPEDWHVVRVGRSHTKLARFLQKYLTEEGNSYDSGERTEEGVPPGEPPDITDLPPPPTEYQNVPEWKEESAVSQSSPNSTIDGKGACSPLKKIVKICRISTASSKKSLEDSSNAEAVNKGSHSSPKSPVITATEPNVKPTDHVYSYKMSPGESSVAESVTICNNTTTPSDATSTTPNVSVTLTTLSEATSSTTPNVSVTLTTLSEATSSTTPNVSGMVTTEPIVLSESVLSHNILTELSDLITSFSNNELDATGNIVSCDPQGVPDLPKPINGGQGRAKTMVEVKEEEELYAELEEEDDFCDHIDIHAVHLAPHEQQTAVEMLKFLCKETVKTNEKLNDLANRMGKIEKHLKIKRGVSDISSSSSVTDEMPSPNVSTNGTPTVEKSRSSSECTKETPTVEKTRSSCECTKFIKKQLGRQFRRQELEEGSYTDAVKNYKDTKIVSKALSPTRLGKILSEAKRNYPEEYSRLSIQQLINDKCRQARNYVRKNPLLADYI